jgi:hypothetical protein
VVCFAIAFAAVIFYLLVAHLFTLLLMSELCGAVRRPNQ